MALKFIKSLFSSPSPAPKEANKPQLPSEEKLRPHKRRAWKPIVAPGDGSPGASKFSGSVLVPAGARWPTCPNCGNPLQLFVQLNAADFPEAAPWPWPRGLLQLFYCTNGDPLCEVDCEAYFPFSRSTLLRVLDLGTPTEVAALPAANFASLRITGWTEIDDLPHPEESASRAFNESELDAICEAGYPRAGDKLLGWPAWVQGVEYPNCPTCRKPMEYLFQIDSEDNVPHMFGDVGCGHISFCGEHPNVLAFAWACS